MTLKYVSTTDIVLSRRFDVLFLLFFKAGPYVGGEHMWHTLTGVPAACSLDRYRHLCLDKVIVPFFVKKGEDSLWSLSNMLSIIVVVDHFLFASFFVFIETRRSFPNSYNLHY